MLFVLLYFHPKFLTSERAKMREIVDKHFYDNWVIPVYMGNIIDLTIWWSPYKAASAALSNTMTKDNIKQTLKSFVKKLDKFDKKADELLIEGVLSIEFCLNNVDKLL